MSIRVRSDTYTNGIHYGLPRLNKRLASDQEFSDRYKKLGVDTSIKRIRKGGGGGSTGTSTIFQLVYEDTLVQLFGIQVVALDVPTGKKLWQTTLQNGAFIASMSRDGQRVYIGETFEPHEGWGRWGSFGMTAMVALDMTNGKEIWRNSEWGSRENLKFGKKVKHPTNIAEIIELDGQLFAYDQSSNIASDYHADLYAIDPLTGKVNWDFQDANFKNPQREYHKHGSMTNNMVAWNGGLFNRIARYDLTGPTAQRGAFPLIGGISVVYVHRVLLISSFVVILDTWVKMARSIKHS